jgi:hypothetical protein
MSVRFRAVPFISRPVHDCYILFATIPLFLSFKFTDSQVCTSDLADAANIPLSVFTDTYGLWPSFFTFWRRHFCCD